LADDVDQSASITAKHIDVPLLTVLDAVLPPLALRYKVKDGWILIEPIN
jgi:hypothetical protein